MSSDAMRVLAGAGVVVVAVALLIVLKNGNGSSSSVTKGVTTIVKAGGSVSFDFPATIEGVFEAELEGRREQILELTVNP
jgi:hypothetical protein